MSHLVSERHLSWLAAAMGGRGQGGHVSPFGVTVMGRSAHILTTPTWLTFSNPTRTFRRCQRLQRSDSRIEKWCSRSTSTRSCIFLASAIVERTSRLGGSILAGGEAGYSRVGGCGASGSVGSGHDLSREYASTPFHVMSGRESLTSFSTSASSAEENWKVDALDEEALFDEHSGGAVTTAQVGGGNGEEKPQKAKAGC